MKEPLVLLVIAVADTHPSGMPPELGRYEQEPHLAVGNVVCRIDPISAPSSRLNNAASSSGCGHPGGLRGFGFLACPHRGLSTKWTMVSIQAECEFSKCNT
jgi:hypothetical protein